MNKHIPGGLVPLTYWIHSSPPFQLSRGSIQSPPPSASTTILREGGAGWSSSVPPSCRLSILITLLILPPLGIHNRPPVQLRHSLHSHSQSIRSRECNELRWEMWVGQSLHPMSSQPGSESSIWRSVLDSVPSLWHFAGWTDNTTIILYSIFLESLEKGLKLFPLHF